MTREELLVAEMPIEQRCAGRSVPIVYRYRTEHEAATHLKAEARALGILGRAGR